MEIPEWIASILDTALGSATDQVVEAKAMETLWAAKGRLTAIKEIKREIELAQAESKAKEQEFVEGFVSHGN